MRQGNKKGKKARVFAFFALFAFFVSISAFAMNEARL
jgi:hypothetical protein